MHLVIYQYFPGFIIKQFYQQTSLTVRKSTFWQVRLTRTQISLRIRAVWSESSLSARRNCASLAIQNVPSEDSDQTARMRRLIWIFAGRTLVSKGTFSDVWRGTVIGVWWNQRTLNDQGCKQARRLSVHCFFYNLSASPNCNFGPHLVQRQCRQSWNTIAIYP